MGLGDGLSNIAGDFGVNIGTNAGSRVGDFLLQMGIFIVLAGCVFVIGLYFYQKKTYCHKIQIFEEINGQTVPTKQFKAKELTIPHSSIKVFQIKENKMYLPRPTIQTGKNNWLFFIRDDHEWVNTGISSLNKQLTELGLNYNHVDMRYANASLKELIKVNYGEKNWWKEYGHIVIMAGFLLIAGIMIYLVAEQFAEASKTFLESTQVNADVLKEISNKLDSVAPSGVTKLN
jgi:hypothetical protein